MSDFPPGQWSPLLVGHQWPSSESVHVLRTAAASRASTASELERYADELRSVRAGPLGNQEGVTADDARRAFQLGEDKALELSTKTWSKSNAYRKAQSFTTSLREDLTNLALVGNLEIEQIQASDEAPVKKVAAIVETVLRSQMRASSSAAYHCGNLLGAVQELLDDDGAGVSAREFARVNGMDLDRAFGTSSHNSVGQQVEAALDQMRQSPNSVAGLSNNFLVAGNDEVSQPSTMIAASAAGSSSSPLTKGAADTVEQLPATTAGPFAHSAAPSFVAAGADKSVPRGVPATVSIPAQNTASATTSPGALGRVTTTPCGSSTTSAGLQSSSPTPALSPEGLANNFNSGLHAGAPVSTGAEALSNNAVQAQAPVHSQPVHPAQMAPTAGTPIFETSHAAHTPVDTAVPTPPADAPQTVIAAAPPPAVPIAPAPPAAAPAGPLPAYGADLRPAAAAPAGPPPVPMTAPGSAPGNPTATALNQPAVVRQQPVATPQNAPAGLTENAVAATATGAASGAGATHTQARHRLQRLLDFVARQEPKLRWAIGDREDGSTVVVTDLAGGWVPPHVRIPVGVTLLAPGRRTGPPTTLLGPTRLTATYSPGQYIAPDDAEPVRTSIRARQTADVEELGWELSRATKWRDGLPRLAHTLAKAASSGSGYLDSEIDLLNAHLQAITDRALGDYPDNHDPATVGNWQLLAGIAALINNERICANYHLAWFQATSLTPTGEAQR